jgi:hypothetical protein
VPSDTPHAKQSSTNAAVGCLASFALCIEAARGGVTWLQAMGYLPRGFRFSGPRDADIWTGAILFLHDAKLCLSEKTIPAF